VKRVTAEGKTVEEAIATGLKQLGVPRDEVEVRILEEPGRRLFGLFSKRTAKVELVWRPDPIQKVRHFMQEVIHWMGVPAQLDVAEDDQRLRIRLSGEQLGLYIGHRGETLQALQYLASLVVNRYSERYVPVELDAGDYRRRREEALRQMALRLAEKAMRTGRPVALEPMSAWERRCIHLALSDHRHVYTESQGEGSARHIVIYLKEEQIGSERAGERSAFSDPSALRRRPRREGRPRHSADRRRNQRRV